MKLNFTNKKDRRYCQAFIKGIKEVQEQNVKDQQLLIYLTANPQQLKLASSIQDLHRTRVSKSCIVIMKSETFTLQLQEQKRLSSIYKVNCFKAMKALKKNEGKITFIELQCDQGTATLTFQTENRLLGCQLKLQCQEIKQGWPQQPDSEDQASYQIIKLSNFSQEQLKTLSLGIEEEQVWLQIWEGGIYLRTVENGKYRKQNKILLKEDDGFISTTVKAKLKRKLFIQIRGQFLLEILYDSLKKKRSISLAIKNIYSRYNENQITMSYLIAKTETDCGYIIGVNYCHICEQMGKQGDETIRRQIAVQREARESTLLKRQEGTEEMRRMMLNRLNQLDQDKRIAEAAYKDRRPVGKIEQGQETFTRRFCSKF